jgi:receptor expression-enhancing protein 5/6
VERSTGYPKTYFFLATAAILSAVLTIVGGTKLIVDLLGFVYPAYMSFKAMDTTGTTTDDTQWLTYWVVFSFMNLAESLFGFLIFLIPFYLWIKIVLIVWMYHPSTKGAETIYQQALRPYLLPYIKPDKSD